MEEPVIQTVEDEEWKYYRDKTNSYISSFKSNGAWVFEPKSRKFYQISKTV
jgi:hypothetical protein